jgi:hypothetical protein
MIEFIVIVLALAFNPYGNQYTFGEKLFCLFLLHILLVGILTMLYGTYVLFSHIRFSWV